VAVEETKSKEEAQPKAEVSDSEFLDVIWGAETSARPTLNIAEMMKAFQVQTKETTTVVDRTVDRSKTLSLDMAMQVKPHPEKVSWGGEDAVFMNGRSFGVFDGVSGAEKEKGKKLYSKSLADSMKKSSSKSSWTVSDIKECMNDAKELADNEGTGATTAVVASIGEDNVLRALNLGDSVCLVVRDGAVAARTREIVHYFDCPYQLGLDSPDRPKDGTTLETDIYPGDIIIAGSDGVFDNLSDGDILDLVSSNANAKSSVIAKKICDTSRTVSLDYDAITPYSRAARGRSGYAAYQSGRGGKVDDISCVVVKAS
jgi:protein phosphatase PTC7